MEGAGGQKPGTGCRVLPWTGADPPVGAPVSPVGYFFSTQAFMPTGGFVNKSV
jgi:hypothetical protein